MRYSAIITNGIFKCSTAITQEGPDISIPLAASMGYDAVQLVITSKEDYDIQRLKEILKENGIFVHALATGMIYTRDHLSMGSEDEGNRLACVDRLCGLVEVCSDLDGAKLIVGAVRGRTSDASDPERYHRQFGKSLIDVCDYAQKYDVQVMLELIEHAESDCCNKLPELLDYLHRSDRSNLRMYFDTMHLYHENEDICKILKEYAGGAPQIDISGENRKSPLDSAIDFDAVFKTIKDSGFDGVLNMEFNVASSPMPTLKELQYVRSFF